MTMTAEARRGATAEWLSLTLTGAAVAPAEQVLTSLDSSPDGLSSAQAQRRLEIAGPNALRSHGARPLAVLARQLRNPLLVLLLGAALTSFFVGERLDALIIFLISGLSIGLGFFNEYRSERAVEALHSQLRHTALVVREEKAERVDVTELVPAFMGTAYAAAAASAWSWRGYADRRRARSARARLSNVCANVCGESSDTMRTNPDVILAAACEGPCLIRLEDANRCRPRSKKRGHEPR